MDFWTIDRIKKLSIILAHIVLIFWILYVVFHTNSIDIPFIILNYIGMCSAGLVLFKYGPKDAQ